MKNIKLLALCAIAAGIVLSCQKEEISNDFLEVQPESLELSKDLQSMLLDAGVNPAGAFLEDIQLLDEVSKEYIVAGDIMLEVKLLKEGAYSLENIVENGVNNKQYRTNNLVAGSNRSINILGFTGSGNALTSRMRNGLQFAVNNYNRLNNNLTFNLAFGSNIQNADMIVFNNNRSGAGGSAGFPSNGAPNRLVQINGGTGSFSNDINEHVITHEIGHSIGLRHTDFARRRCGGGNEGISNSGAINIPGTPTENRWGFDGIDSNSIMISCLDGSENGEFSNFDVVALNFLY